MRRIMRPSADNAGQPAPGGEAAPDATAPLGEPNPGANPFARPAPPEETTAAGAAGEEPATAELSAVAEPAPGEQPETGDAADPGDVAAPDAGATAAIPVAAEEEQPPWRARLRRQLLRRRAKPAAPAVIASEEPQPVAEAAVVLPAPEGPAGLDPAEADTRPPAGRRGRLRRRLRYLRRARELMLRDLGGLIFEIHRTGGGDMAAHAPVVEGKIERLRHLDRESIALEEALGAPRGETVVFQPGIGGTCLVCGELFSSSARFCSECGTSTEASLATFESPGTTVIAPPDEPPGSLGLARSILAFTGGRRPADEAETGAPAAEEQPTTALEPEPQAAAEPEPATAAEPGTADEPEPAASEPEPSTPPSEPEPSTPASEPDPPAAAEPRSPATEPERNGTAAPTLQPGDPLARRDRP